MTRATLQAVLYTEAVLPAFGLLAAHDPALPPLLAGEALGVALKAPGDLRVRLGIDPGGLTVSREAHAGDLRFWFPHAACLSRVFQQRRTFACPVGGWRQLRRAGARLRPLEALVVLKRKALRFCEVPARMRPRLAGVSTIGSWKAVYYMVRVLLGVFVNVIKYERRFHQGNRV
jgi:hypothetical protein